MLPTMLPHTDAAILALIQERQRSLQQAVARRTVRHIIGTEPLPELRRRPLPGMPALAGALLGVVRPR